MAVAHDQRDICDAQHTPDGKHHKHRYERLACAAADGSYRVRIGEQTVKEGNDTRLPRCQRDNLRRPAEQTCQLRHGKIHGDADQLGKQQGADDAEARAGFCAVIFLRAEVLAGIGRKRHGKACNRQEGEAFELAVGAVSCHGDFAEGIDVRLHDDVCKSDDGILHAGRKPVAKNQADHFTIGAQMRQPQTVFCCLA